MHIIYSVMYNAHLSQTIDLKFFKNIQMHMFQIFYIMLTIHLPIIVTI